MVLDFFKAAFDWFFAGSRIGPKLSKTVQSFKMDNMSEMVEMSIMVKMALVPPSPPMARSCPRGNRGGVAYYAFWSINPIGNLWWNPKVHFLCFEQVQGWFGMHSNAFGMQPHRKTSDFGRKTCVIQAAFGMHFNSFGFILDPLDSFSFFCAELNACRLSGAVKQPHWDRDRLLLLKF